MEQCPKQIPIPDIFAIYNRHLAGKEAWNETKEMLLRDGGNLAECLQCGKCEELCPQNITIRTHLDLLRNSINL